MSQVNIEIGQRIRGIRELCELDIPILAHKLGLSADILEDYESGSRDIPVSVLHEISVLLNISMTELLTGESAKLHIYSLVRAGKGVGVDRRAAYDYKSLAYNFADRRLDPFLITIEPKPEGEEYSLNSHSGHEFHFCLEGSFKIKIDKYEMTLYEGDALYFDSSYPHGMLALGGAPAKELVIIV